MLKNYKGFTLMEVMVSLFILTSVLIMVFPFLTTYYVEGKTIREQEISLQILSNELNRWVITKEKTQNDIILHHTQYHLSWQGDNTHVKLCVSWTGSNRRSYVQCGNAKNY